MIVFCVFSFCIVTAQDTVSLHNVEIIGKKSSLSAIGKKTEEIDSAVKQQFKFGSVADLIGSVSPVFIKSYGPGSIATTAFRGGNASQTAILWNGFNLQNAMLGQSDLSLMPAVLFEDVEIEYGGSSSLWGSGAVGGSIHLNNKNPFNGGLAATAHFVAGSIGAFNGSGHVLVSKRRFISSTKFYKMYSENSYRYRDTLDKENPEKVQRHAGYDFKGLMQEFKWILNSRQMLSISGWLNDNQRKLPAANPSVESKADQRDAATRFTANWSYQATRFKSLVRAAYFKDRIEYNDSLISVFSDNKVQTLIAENENYFNWAPKQQLNFGVNFSSSSAIASNYIGRRSMSRASFLAGNRSSLLNEKLSVYFCARIEYFSVGTLPLTGNVSANYVPIKNVTAKINAGRVYRQPTLNDLYWVPGGNIALKPEQGYTLEGELNYERQIKNFSVFISGAAFGRKIDNWILWVPGANGNPSPVNIQQVWSRGTESTFKIGYRKNKLKTGITLLTAYVLSTTEKSLQENSNTQHRQLIYTPRYSVNGNFFVTYGHFSIFYFHQYVGYRFTTSDNSSWLPPYQVSSLKLNYNVRAKKVETGLFAAVNNLFNSSYNIISGRPMPLRNFEIGMSIQAKKN